MKSVSSILSTGRRGQMAVVAAIAVAAVAVIVTMAINGGGKTPADADSLAAPAAQVPHDPPTSGAAYVRITANGNFLEGESVYGIRQGVPDPDGWTDVLEYNHSITSSDRTSGLATGRRIHSPIVITKRIDKSSPQLLQAMDQNQVVELVLEFERLNPNGDVETYYRIETTNGRITGIRRNAGLLGGDTETLSITYQTLIESHETENTQAQVSVSQTQ